jgi:excisionase family DNA binding protein
VRKEMKMLPMPLTSPVTSAVAGDGGPERPPACRIAHGPCDSYFENIVGNTVASIRRCLATVFSIPDDTEAFVGGSVVGPEYRLRAGDSLEFLKRWGRKGVGDLLTPEQLIQRWHITEEQYQQLLKAGLPTIRFEDGTVRHPEPAVDDWLRSGGGGRLKRLTLTDGHDSTEGPPAAKKWCNIEEAARLSGRSVTTIRRDIKGGTLRAHVVGRGRRRPSYRIRRADLKAYIEAGRAEPPDPPAVPTTTVRKKSRHFD